MDINMILEFVIIIACLLLGIRYGGFGLGLISGLGLLVFAFVFGLAPGKPPVDVLLTIMAVLGCASVLQTAGGLNVMMSAGALIVIFCKVVTKEIPNGTVFKAGMVAVISIFGVAWMADTVFDAHFEVLKSALAGVVATKPWTYAIVLFIVSKLVSSQAAAVAAIAPLGVSLGVDPKMIVAFISASYGYFILPTYASDLACIGFDRSGTTRIGKFIINHSFIIPGLIGVVTGCTVGYLLLKLIM